MFYEVSPNIAQQMVPFKIYYQSLPNPVSLLDKVTVENKKPRRSTYLMTRIQTKRFSLSINYPGQFHSIIVILYLVISSLALFFSSK
jgi:hypothetical protein